MEYKLSFVNKEITPWSGFAIMKQMLEKMGLKEYLSKLYSVPKKGSNRGYESYDIIIGFMLSVWCGANKFLHTEQLRHDKGLSKIFGWKQAPGNDTYKRFFKKFDLSRSSRYSKDIFKWILSNVNVKRITLDCDSTVLTRYGLLQQGAMKGYNPKKPGRNSHHPLIAFVNDLRLVANFWLRSGDTHSANNFTSFLMDTIDNLSGKIIGLIRLDSGFFTKEVLSLLESQSLNYIVAARFYVPIQKAIALKQNWILLDEGIEICDTEYQAETWEEPRRLIIVRQKTSERPNAAGKQLSLFKDEEYFNKYRYSAFVTNMDLSSAEIWRLYKQRADSENRIKELKDDFGLDSFNVNDFYATEAALTTTMLAYNIMSIFRMVVLKSEIQNKLSTLRYTTFAIGAYFTKIKDQYVLNIALLKTKRKWYTGLWHAANSINIPFQFSNA